MKVLDLYSFIRIKNTSTCRERNPTSFRFPNFNDQNSQLDSSIRDRRISDSVFNRTLSVCLFVLLSVIEELGLGPFFFRPPDLHSLPLSFPNIDSLYELSISYSSYLFHIFMHAIIFIFFVEIRHCGNSVDCS